MISQDLDARLSMAKHVVKMQNATGTVLVNMNVNAEVVIAAMDSAAKVIEWSKYIIFCYISNIDLNVDCVSSEIALPFLIW